MTGNGAGAGNGARAEIRRFSLPLDAPLSTARGTIDRREGFLFRVARGDDADGVAGIGEAAPLPGWTESLDDCETALREAADAIAGGDGWTAALAACEDASAARHAVDLARADLDARRADVPLYRHLGADERVERVPVNATIGDGDTEETARVAADAVDRGFECVKVKVGARTVGEDVDRLREVRDAVGPDVDLRADANGAWSREQAREAFEAFADLDVSYVEQPLPAGDLAGHADLRDEFRGRSVDVAVDETLASTPVDEVLEAGAADVLVLKPMAIGGVERAHAAALRARELDVTPVVTTTIDAVVARTGAVHVAASLAAGCADVPASGLATADYLASDLGPDPAPVEDGMIAVPQRNGLGVREVSADDA